MGFQTDSYKWKEKTSSREKECTDGRVQTGEASPPWRKKLTTGQDRSPRLQVPCFRLRCLQPSGSQDKLVPRQECFFAHRWLLFWWVLLAQWLTGNGANSELKVLFCSGLPVCCWPVGAALCGLRQKAFGLGCFSLREYQRNSTRFSFFRVETVGPSEVNLPLGPRYLTDPTGAVGFWFLLSVNPADMRVSLFLDPLSFLVTVFPLPCLFPLCLLHSCLQIEMQARVCGEPGSLASVMEREAALESHPLPCLGSALRGSSRLAVSTA